MGGNNGGKGAQANGGGQGQGHQQPRRRRQGQQDDEDGGASPHAASDGFGASTYKGLDSGLAKSAPSAVGLSQKTYRAYRRRLDLFSRQCMRRGRDVAIEGAYLVLSQLQDTARDATEGLDYDDMELAENPFEPLRAVLDLLYQHEEEVELPERCQEFFEAFGREKGEELQAYIVRHQTMLRKLRELKVEVPPLLAGWHMLTRAGVPRWCHPQIKALCGNELTTKNVAKARTRMFGGDSKPSGKDAVLRAGDINMVENYDDFYEEDMNEVYYQSYEDDETYGNYPYELDEIDYQEEEEEYPPELDEAAIATEEAYISYLDSRKKMRELALARGFYPVVALDMGNEKGGGKSNKGGGKSKGKGGGNGKGGKGKGKFNPMAKKFAFGKRGQGKGSDGGSFSGKSTTSGSTAAHGPRFKRYRLPASGIKEVPDEANMVTEVDADNVEVSSRIVDEINTASSEAGWAIMDSGATRTVCGTDAWDQLSQYLVLRDLMESVELMKEVRDFRFGDGVVLRSQAKVRLPVCVAQQWRSLDVHLLPGKTPLLLARPDLERWNVEMLYGKQEVRVDGKTIRTSRTPNGHYMMNLYDDLQDILNVTDLEKEKETDADKTIYLPSMLTDEVSDMEPDVIVEFDKVDDMILNVSTKSMRGRRRLLFWEVYVDEGHLTKYLNHYDDVETRVFSLPEWNFENKETQKRFLDLMEMERPHHVMVAFECRLWSPMQQMNYRTPERKHLLAEMRAVEERTHLDFYKRIHLKGKTIGTDVTLEQPAEAVSWKTETLESMRGYFETVLDRCRTGLKLHTSDKVFVKKPTRFRTTTRRVAEAMNLPCICTQGHQQMMGHGAALKAMQNYEPKLVKYLGDSIFNAMEEAWKKRGQAELMMMEMVEHSTEEMKYLEQNKELIKIGGPEVLHAVARLHRQLGHPNALKLLVVLKDRKMPEEYLRVARQYRCPTCFAKKEPKAVRVATLRKAPHFNHTVSTDVFEMEFSGKKRYVLSIVDEFSRYEVDGEIEKTATAEQEISLLETLWMRSFGFPPLLRLDASGPHQSSIFADWASAHGMRLELIPRGAHHRLGILERNHAVRRKQLEIFNQEMPDVDFAKALLATNHARNRLSSIKGASPATLAFAHQPSEGGNADDPGPEKFGDERDQVRNTLIKEQAAISFHKANSDLALRHAILARARVDQDELMVGDWVFYWKPTTSKHDPYRWRGPCLVVAVESSVDRHGMIYWLVHGSSLLRCTRNQIRHETIPERFERQGSPEYLESLRHPLPDRLVRALKPVRGPTRAFDVAETDSNPLWSPGGVANADAVADFFGTSTLEPAAVPPRHFLEEDPAPAGIWTDAGPNQEPPAKPRTSTLPMEVEPEKKEEKKTEEKIDDLTGPPGIIAVRDDTEYQHAEEGHREKRSYEAALRVASAVSDERNRRLDGLPPRRQEDGQPEQKAAKIDQINMVTMLEEEINMAVVESKLNPDEKKRFVEAKRKSLVPWCENDAWRPADRASAPNGTIVPMRFLLTYKEDEPKARVILQGFKHRDVLESKLDTESPTLSRLGKYLLVVMTCQLRWKLGTMDVKSAFLQADYIHHKVELYGEPSADMRRLLAEMVGLQEHQVMQMTKPAFGDVRAPKQWNDTADKAMVTDACFLKHKLDGCLYLSYRLAHKDDEPYRVFTMDGNNYIVDGVIGLHVDDIIAAGENFYKSEDAVEPQGKPQCFAERMHILLNRFKFGSINYEDNQTFCGCQMKQSLDFSTVTFGLEKYIRQIKPLTVEKCRKANPDEKATDKEVSQLRGILGAMAWPSTQTQPHLAASISLAQSMVSGAKVSELNEANKVLRYAKETADIVLTIRAHGNGLGELRFGFYSDASWSTRPDGSSQGGWLVFIGSEKEFNDGHPFPLTVIDWCSRKLPRVCRSSLAAEAQTMTSAVDNLEWVKMVFGLMIWPSEKADSEHVMKWLGVSPAITDARALFDASTSATPGMKLAEKRTAIEVKITVERLEAACGVMRWCNSHQQLADGMTKAAAKTKLAMELRRGVHSLKYDPEHVASKKVPQEEKDKEQENLDAAAKEFEKKQRIQEKIFRVEDMEAGDKEMIHICLLEGCSLPAEDGRRYCSKRHYHAAHQPRAVKPKTGKPSTASWMVLTASGVAGAEAFQIHEFGITLNYFDLTIAILMFVFATILLIFMGYRIGRFREQRRMRDDPWYLVRYQDEQRVREENPSEIAEHLLDPENQPSPASTAETFNTFPSVQTEEGSIVTPQNPQVDLHDELIMSSNGGVVTWLSPSQVIWLKEEGYYVLSDYQVNQRRAALQADMPLSFDEVFTPEILQQILNGTYAGNLVLPVNPADWNGVPPEERKRRTAVNEAAMLLGLAEEEMNPEKIEEAAKVRAQLRTVRAVEESVRAHIRHQPS